MNKIYNQLLPVALFIEGGMHIKCSYSIAACIAVYLFNYHIFKRNESYCDHIGYNLSSTTVSSPQSLTYEPKPWLISSSVSLSLPWDCIKWFQINLNPS